MSTPGLNWKRVPELERRQIERQRGPPSWIYRYGWTVWHRKKRRNYWLCFYCHKHRFPGGVFDVSTSTSSAGTHVKQFTRGHGFDAEGPIARTSSAEGTIMRAVGRSIVEKMRDQGVAVSQEVANELASSFTIRKFQDALKDWIQADKQSLRVIETTEFRRLIEAANPLAEATLWSMSGVIYTGIQLSGVDYTELVRWI